MTLPSFDQNFIFEGDRHSLAKYIRALVNGLESSLLISSSVANEYDTSAMSAGLFGYCVGVRELALTDALTEAKCAVVGMFNSVAGSIVTSGTVTAAFTTAGGQPANGAFVYLAEGTADTSTGLGKLTATIPSASSFKTIVGVCVDNSNYTGAKTCVVEFFRVGGPVEVTA